MKPLKKTVIVYRTAKEYDTVSSSFVSTSLNVNKSLSYRSRTQDGFKIHAYLLPKGTKAIVVNGTDDEIILPIGFNLNRYKNYNTCKKQLQ